MKNLKEIIKEVLEKYNIKKDCGCGCNDGCGRKKSPMLNENLTAGNYIFSENLQYHINNKLPLTENTFRYGSNSFLDLWAEARKLYSRNLLDVYGIDKEIILETNLGEYGIFEGQKVPLDLPMINEAEYHGKDIQLNKPKRDSSRGKAYKVYVKDPKTKKIKMIRFGSGALKAKINNPKARRAFAKRQRCGNGEEKTSPKWWSCRLPRFAKLLGLKGTYSGFW